MKKLLTILMLFGVCCALHAQNVYTQKQPGIEGEYKTFTFLNRNDKSSMDKQDLLVFDDPYMTSIWVFGDPKYPDTNTNTNIQDAITQELIRKGYKKVKKGGDMLVSYTVFAKDGAIKGGFVNNKGDAYPNTNEDISIKKGTLMISIIDRKTGKALWHGFDKNTLGENATIKETQSMKAVTNTLGSFTLD